MESINRVLTDYILHRGDTGRGEGIALIWIEENWPVPDGATVSMGNKSSNKHDLIIAQGHVQITLKGVHAGCHQLVREGKGLYVIHQPANQMPQSLWLPLAG